MTEPTMKQVEAGAKAFHEEDCSCGVSLKSLGDIADTYRRIARAVLVAALSVDE